MSETIVGKRCFICCNDPFPFGTANSNYIRNLALLLNEAGMNVTVIGLKEEKNFQRGRECSEYKGVNYVNIIAPKSKLPFRVRNHLCLGNWQKDILAEYELTENDYVFVYTDFISVSEMLLKNFPRVNEKGHLVYVIVEWFQAHQYSMSGLSWDYLLWKRHFDKIMPKYKRIIAISQNLKKHFDEVGCNTLVLPCLVNTQDTSMDIQAKKVGEKYRFIYPGAATNKDSLEGMIKGFAELTDDELEKVEMHFTSLTVDKLKKAAKCSDSDLDKLKNVLVFHGWLEYEDLLKLYKTMDFIFIAREENRITLSNFPSKIPEMMAYGVVPVCSDVGDCASIYLNNGQDSVVFKGASPDECAEAIKKAISVPADELLKMKYAARDCAETKLDYRNWKQIITRYLED